MRGAAPNKKIPAASQKNEVWVKAKNIPQINSFWFLHIVTPLHTQFSFLVFTIKYISWGWISKDMPSNYLCGIKFKCAFFSFSSKTKKNKQKSKYLYCLTYFNSIGFLNKPFHIYLIQRITFMVFNVFFCLFVQLLVQEKEQVQEETRPTLLERRGHELIPQLKV